MGNMHRLSLSEIINKVIVDLISDAIIELMKQRNTMPKKVVVAFSGHAGLCYSSVFEQLRLLPDSTSVIYYFRIPPQKIYLAKTYQWFHR